MVDVIRLNIGDRAPEISVLDTQGTVTPLSSLWANGPTLLTFLRHFGCIHCRSRLAELEQNKDALENAGLQLVAVGLGRPEHAAHYCGRLAPDLTCFSDTVNDGYYAYGLRQGTGSELMKNAMNVAKASAKAFAKGHIQGRATGDAHMLPGTFIIDQGGVIRYTYYSQYAGDDPAIPVLVEAAKGLSATPTA